ncbi:uncharacterized protein CBL_04633 [Carabus blaptoides fortunei]
MHKERLFSCSAESSATTSSMGTSDTVSESGSGDVANLDEARRIIRDLKQRYRSQTQQLLAWRRAHKIQEELVVRLHREKSDQLKVLSSKLLLFESRLVRKQKDISALLNHREAIIYRQQRIIETLTNRLIDNGLEPPNTDLTEFDVNILDMDSLNDSDSAVIMEDMDSDSTVSQIVPRFRSSSADSITVMRSISDAIDPSLKYSSMRRSNGFLRRPEILETVYSVEEDGDADNTNTDAKTSVSLKRESFANSSGKAMKLEAEEEVFVEDAKETQSSERSAQNTLYADEGETIKKNPINQMTTYNRVMSNHRSVTKPKDVKYKRINKAKSKSLEELRGRLKNWVEQGNKLTDVNISVILNLLFIFLELNMATIEPELKLKRFLYHCSESSTYTASKRNNYDFCQLDQVQSIFELVSADKSKLIIELIQSVNKDPLCARRETLLFVLAVCARNCENVELKNKAYNTVLNVCNSTQELFLFIKFVHSLNKNFSHGIRRIVHDYYLKREPAELAHIITNCNSYYGWSHKDIINMVHLKPDNLAQDILLTYAIKNVEEAKKKINENNKSTTEEDEIIKKLDKLHALKHCQNEQDAVTLMRENQFCLQHVPAPLLKSQILWEYLIPTLELPALLTEIGRLNRLGFLKNTVPICNKVIEALSDAKKCQTSKLLPAQVLIYLKTYERGKALDPQKKAFIAGLNKSENVLNDPEKSSEVKKEKAADAKKLKVKSEKSDVKVSEMKRSSTKDQLVHTHAVKNNAVISAFYKLLQHSYSNVRNTGRRVLITLDARECYMNRLCFENKSVLCMEAALIIALSFLKAEKDVTIAVFNESSLTLVPTDKGMTYGQAQQALKEIVGGLVLLTTPITWASENKKHIDVFINLIGSSDALHRIPKEKRSQELPIESLIKYRKQMRLPNTKMITVSLGSRKLTVADGSPHVLDICGFDHNVPRVIEACCRGVL